jgi:hypothetical protein
MGKNDGSGDSIYGQIPDGGADAVVKQALGNADNFFSNTINGPIKTKNSQYPEKE